MKTRFNYQLSDSQGKTKHLSIRRKYTRILKGSINFSQYFKILHGAVN